MHDRQSIDHRGARRLTAGLAAAALATLAAGCVVKETRPLPKLTAVQATHEIPADQLLDVGVRLFDPGLTKEIEEHPEQGEKKRIYPEIRKAEARYMPTLLRTTLEGTGQWGAVRVVPKNALTDVAVDGKIVESSGYSLTLEISVADATGRHWFTKTYSQRADTSTYRDGTGKGRDPFQNIYAHIADDMLAYRNRLQVADVSAIPRITRLRFGRDLAPAAYNQYLAQDKAREGQPAYHAVSLPAAGDPIAERVERIHERDAALIDTVSDHYGAFADKLGDAYTGWRRSTYDEIEAEQKVKEQALVRKLLGAGAIVGAIALPNMCGSNSGSYGSYVCRNAENMARGAAVGGGVMAIMSGIQKGKEAQMHTDTIKEITGSFQADAAPQVVEVEGRTLKLTGNAEAQYAEWRQLLRDLYQEETGVVADAPASPDSTPAAAAPAKDRI